MAKQGVSQLGDNLWAKQVQWETKYGLARRNDQLEGYLQKKVYCPLSLSVRNASLGMASYTIRYSLIVILSVCFSLRVGTRNMLF